MERVTLLIRNEWHHVIEHRIPLITEFAKMRGLPHRCNPLQTDISAHTARKKNEGRNAGRNAGKNVGCGVDYLGSRTGLDP